MYWDEEILDPICFTDMIEKWQDSFGRQFGNVPEC